MNAPADRHRVRIGATALAISAILFVAYPAVRPFSDETSLQGARAFASTAWVVAHGLAVLGFTGLALGLLGVHLALRHSRADRLSFRALVLSWVGTGLTLTFYGAEAFGLHVIGQEALREHRSAVLSLAHDVRYGPGLLVFVGGLALLAVGAIMMASAIWRSGTLVKWSAVPLALGVALYLPQFAASQPIRVGHGLLLAAGCLSTSVAMWRRGSSDLPRERVSSVRQRSYATS